MPLKEAEPAYGTGDASFRAAGGEEGLRRLTEAFYAQMDSLPEAREIRAMHPPDLSMATDKLARFLCGWLGGPKRYQEKYGPISIPDAHRHLDVSASERDAWLACMERAIAAQPFRTSFKTYLLAQLRIPAERIRVVCAERAGAGSS